MWLLVVATRILWFAPTMLGLLLLVFVLSRVVPVDPAILMAGENASADQVQRVREDIGLDRPLPVQFLTYVRNVLQGDFGTSLYTHQSVFDDLCARLAPTFELTFVAALLAALIGIPLGVACALRQNLWLDYALRIAAASCLAAASFWLAMQFQLLFSLELGWLPLAGRTEGFPPETGTGLLIVDATFAGDWELLGSTLRHIALPAFTLALPAAATLLRFTRNGMISAIHSPSVAYQTAMGLPRRTIIWKYALRMALTGAVTQLGLVFGILLTGAIVVETIFDWPGLGSFAVRSILQSDYNAVMGFTLFAGAIFVLVNLLVDLLQAAIDPRGAP
jgi:peptide/nickel transport system permease protein